MVSPLEVAVINSWSDVNARAMYWGHMSETMAPSRQTAEAATAAR